jgi:hypothetical protein
MFRTLPVFPQQPEALAALAARMVVNGSRPHDNPDIPSGYAWLGQFIDHDITFDPVSSSQRQNDPDALHAFRPARFDLDSLYGGGAGGQPYMYEESGGLTRFRLGEEVGLQPGASGSGPDLPRNEPRERGGQPVFTGQALIADPRNDENLLMSQLHCTMLRFHNSVMEFIAAHSPLTGADLFKEVQRLVRWHFQWVVVNDFLPRVVGQAVVDDILRIEELVVGGHGRPPIARLRPRFVFYKPDETAYLPIEFFAGAYRFGHSMIRGSYHINYFVREARGGRPIPLFGPETPPDELENLNGFRRLPPQWAVDWTLFFELQHSQEPQASLAIDTSVATPVSALPASRFAGPPHSLPERDLLRGNEMGLPAGNTVARAMGMTPLSAYELGISDIDPALAMHPPLLFYVLKEAELLEGGRKLGPVGGRIVAEVLLGLLAHDPLSYLSVEPNWGPVAPMARDDGSFDMPQLIRFATQL